MQLDSHLITYGYLFIIVGTFLEGEICLVAAIFLCQKGYLDLRWVLALAFIGGFVGDQVCYYIGYSRGASFLKRRKKWRERADSVFSLLHRYPTLVALSFHFFYGIRSVTPFVIGASRYSRLRFFLLNGIGVAAWTAVIAWLSLKFGPAMTLVMDAVKKYDGIAVGALVGIAALTWLFIVIWRRLGRVQA